MVLGKLIVLYGVNNLGKSTQAKILVEALKKLGFKTEYIKYPIYDLEPSGPRINSYLRKANPENLSAKQVQELYVQNRSDYAETLKQKIDEGTIVIAEDYWGTGVAWGAGGGVDKEYLLELNQPFQNEDLAILIEGERFSSGIEDSHKHEENSELTNKVANIHTELADKFGWKKIYANRSIEEVSADIWKEVKKVLN